MINHSLEVEKVSGHQRKHLNAYDQFTFLVFPSSPSSDLHTALETLF